MYNLSPRWRKTNLEDLGPNTYYICGSNLCPVVPRRCTFPFSATISSDRSNRRKAYCDKFYSAPKTKIRGCTGLQLKSERFKSAVFKDICEEKKSSSEKSPGIGKGKLYVCNIDLNYGVSAPSIPSKRDENGYDLDENGGLIKIPQNEIKESVGPNEYDISRCSCCNCEKYRGCCWSKSKTKRFQTNAENIPGPGTYNLEVPEDKQKQALEEYRQMARLFSFLPRYLDEQQILRIKENYPSPAAYYPDLYKCNICPSVTEQIFISTSARFKYSSEKSPGPADYDPRISWKRTREKCCPLSTSSRFPKSKYIVNTPGPGAYTLKSPLQQKLDSKSNRYSTADVPFNTTAKRSTHPKNENPGPGEYDLNFRSGCGGEIPNSAFKSKVKRFPVKCKEDLPCALDVNTSYNATQRQKSHNVKNVSFNIKDVKKEIIKEGPGPGEYDLFLEYCDGRTVPRDYPRFKEAPFMSPGVGTYHIHPSHGESTYKARDTFNIMLKEKVLKKKLRLPPKETYKPWCEKLKKHRTLRWFHDRRLPPC